MINSINNSFDDLFPSPYLRSEDFGHEDMILTISKVEIELLGRGDQAEKKGVLSFNELPKRLVLNRTNATIIKNMYGSQFPGWIGKRIALFKTEVPFGNKMVSAIRVKPIPPIDQQPPEQDGEPSGPVYPT